MRSIRYLAMAIAIVFANTHAWAEDGKITLSRALSFTEQNNLTVRQARQDVAVAAAQLSGSWADLLLPNVSASGSFNYTDPAALQKTYDRVVIGSQSYTITNSWADNYSAGLSVSKTIWDGLKLWNAKDDKEWNLALAKRKLEDAVSSARVGVKTAFYQLLLSRLDFEASRAEVSNLKSRLDYLQASYRQGLSTEIECLTASVAWKNAIPALTLASNSMEDAQTALCNLCGIRKEDRPDFSGSLEELSNVFSAVPDAPSLPGKAISNDVTLASIDYSIRSARLSRTSQELAKYPSLSGSFSYGMNYRKDNSTMTNGRTWQGNWSTGLQLSLPIDDWLPFSSVSLALVQADENIKKLQLSREARIDAVKADFETRRGELGRLREIADARSEALLLAQKQLGLLRAQINQNSANMLDVADAQAAENRGVEAYWKAALDYASAVWQFKYLTGTEGGTL